MSKKSELHRWALIRPDFTERASVEATNRTTAAQKLRAIIRKGALPKGWKVVDTGIKVMLPAKPDPAPQPKAEEEDPPATPEVIIQRYRDEVLSLQSEVRELTGNITFKDQEIDRQMAEIAILKAEVERLGGELAEVKTSRSGWMQDAELYAQNSAHHQKRADTAEAKLADIAAIKRVQEMEPNLPASRLIQRVLDGAA